MIENQCAAEQTELQQPQLAATQAEVFLDTIDLLLNDMDAVGALEKINEALEHDEC